MDFQTLNHLENPVTGYGLTQQLQNIKSECFSGNWNKAKKEHLYRQRLRDFFQNEIIQFKNGKIEKSDANIREEDFPSFLNRLVLLTQKIQTELWNNNFWNNINKEINKALDNFINWREVVNNSSQSTATKIAEILES